MNDSRTSVVIFGQTKDFAPKSGLGIRAKKYPLRRRPRAYNQ